MKNDRQVFGVILERGGEVNLEGAFRSTVTLVSLSLVFADSTEDRYRCYVSHESYQG